MEPDAFDIRRIDVGRDISVWVPVAPAGGPRAPASPEPPPEAAADPAPLERAWRVRPAGVALGGAFALAALVRIGVTPEGLLAAGVLCVLGVLALIDLEARLLPNRIVLPAIAAVLAWQLVFLPERFAEAALAALGAAAFLLLPSLFRRGAMGMGDVKLAALLGAALGAPVAFALAVGSVAAWPVALALVVRGASVRGATIPFGPFLAFGAAVVLLG
jgi:leader peptidase (prepilin peptidase) / N-methyltransferase